MENNNLKERRNMVFFISIIQKYMSSKLVRKEIFYIALNLLLTFLAVFIVYKLWDRDFSVPIAYNNDALGALVMFKKAVMGEKFSYFENLQAPFGQTIYAQDFMLSYFLVKIIMLFTKNVGIGINVFWLLTYLLTAITCYYFLRKLGCGYISSVMGSIIYNFLPYHYFRLEHFWLMGCFLIPLAGCLALEMLNFNLDKEKKENVYSAIKIAFFCFLIGMNGIYYAFLSIVVLGFTMLYVLFEKKRIVYIGCFLYDVFMISLPIVIFVLLPSILAGGSIFGSLSIGREIGQINTYGLSVLLLLLPIPGHRIEGFNNLTEYVYEQTNVFTEAYTVSLGLIMSIGLIVSALYLFKEKCHETWQIKIRQLGFLNIMIILFATVGGLDHFVAIFLSTMIRCYNRMSVFIALFSIGAFTIVIERILLMVKLEKSWVRNLICILLTVVGIFDQTSACFADYETYGVIDRKYIFNYDSVKKQYEDDAQFFDTVYNNLDSEKILYIEPMEPYITFDNANVQFPRLKLYLNNISSTFCGVKDERYEKWFIELSKNEAEIKMQVLSVLGISGILLDKNGFADETIFEMAQDDIKKYADNEGIVNQNKTLYFYTFIEWKNKYLSSFTIEELNELQMAIKDNIFDDFERISMNSIYNLEENGSLKKGKIQFGPYIDLKKGNYQVLLKGDNLEDSRINVTTQKGVESIEVSNIHVFDDYIEFCFKLNEDKQDVEFTLTNDLHDVYISKYYYRNLNSVNRKKTFNDLVYSQDKLLDTIHLGYSKEDIPFDTLFIKGDGDIYDNEIVLEQNALQFGPYINLLKGKYRITVNGSNLKAVNFGVTSDSGVERYEVEIISKEEDKLVYEFEVVEDVGDFEFLLENDSDETVHIYSYLLEKEMFTD